MPSFPLVPPDMITMGVDTGATHCFAGLDWIQSMADILHKHGYAPKWHSMSPGHLLQADGGKAGTIGVLSIPYTMQSHDGTEVSVGDYLVIAIESASGPPLLSIAFQYLSLIHI